MPQPAAPAQPQVMCRNGSTDTGETPQTRKLHANHMELRYRLMCLTEPVILECSSSCPAPVAGPRRMAGSQVVARPPSVRASRKPAAGEQVRAAVPPEAATTHHPDRTAPTGAMPQLPSGEGSSATAARGAPCPSDPPEREAQQRPPRAVRPGRGRRRHGVDGHGAAHCQPRRTSQATQGKATPWLHHATSSGTVTAGTGWGPPPPATPVPRAPWHAPPARLSQQRAKRLAARAETA